MKKAIGQSKEIKQKSIGKVKHKLRVTSYESTDSNKT